MEKDFITIKDSIGHGRLMLSTLKQYERKSLTESPSIKIVLSGKEHYQINGRPYTLSNNRFIIVDKHSSEEVTIDAAKSVKGICIYPRKDLLNEVSKIRTSPHEELLDDPFETKEMGLLHNQFNYLDNRTGRFLKQHIPSILDLQNKNKPFDLDDFLMRLAESIIDDQWELRGKLKNIGAIKKATKAELFRRVFAAKDFVEDNFTEKISLDDLAQEVYLSKYHFIRTFKDIFHLSPYQYILQLRLQKAQELLAQDYSYNEVSDIIGFSDGKNLRKAIKKIRTGNN